MEEKNITSTIKYIGVNDYDLDLFEGQYIVENGMAYNSYLIMDKHITIMDSVDKRKSEEWLKNIKDILKDKKPEYFVISHLEPDHSSSIDLLLNNYPDIKIVSNAKVFSLLPQFFDIPNLDVLKYEVKEGDILDLGECKLRFIMAPMVHWPEVMMCYEEKNKILFSADAFGKFGTLDTDEEWDCEARRYYFNIVGKYGLQVQNLFKKISNLEIKIICPLHGPILNDNLNHYLNKYNIWSKYEVESDGVFIACASIHGNTLEACKELKNILEKKGIKTVLSDLTRTDFAENIEDCFKYGHIVFASSTYNMEIFPPMRNLLLNLKSKNYQNRTVALIENGTWAPNAIKCMKEIINEMKNINIIDQTITIKTKLSEENRKELELLAEKLIGKEVK
ncbi:MAG: FprA family A-type flavoprotein [Candidatus Onthovivens sp.]|nr:FprA family A-type flavoprotein [Candidatus Onthovivens sp.]